MKIFSIICTRDKTLKPITKELVAILARYGVEIKLLVNQKSIFTAYKKGLDSCKAAPSDIIILCHDDIQILSSKVNFIGALAKCIEKETGIVGPAGTTFLGPDAVWWNHEVWAKGLHRGKVKHSTVKGDTLIKEDSPLIDVTSYGPYGQVVALDGLFLAARREVWDKITLDKPDHFPGLWDFYDIHYTTTSHQLGFKNYTVPIDLIHYSRGDLAGRDSWHNNRRAFISNNSLPLTI